MQHAPSQNENNYLLFQIVKDQPNRRFVGSIKQRRYREAV
jgi:hypothetical protein